jgi:hypothetical protein
MSVQSELSSPKQHKRRRRWASSARGLALAEPLSMLLDAQVLTFHEWARLNRISERTGRRILNSGSGPVVIQLSAKRIGITVAADRAWKVSRERIA